MKTIRPTWSAATKRRIIAYVEKWRGLLLLTGYCIDVQFETTPCESDDATAAEMRGNWPYHSGHVIRIYPHFLENKDEREQERRIIHELCHIITRGMRALMHDALVKERLVLWREVDNTEESLVDWFANAVYAMEYER